jgi:hypothetical protein
MEPPVKTDSPWPRSWVRAILAALFLPAVLCADLWGITYVPDTFVGKWFSGYWVYGSALGLIALVFWGFLRRGLPALFRRWWGLWLIGALVFNSVALVGLLMGLAFMLPSRALTTDMCPDTPLASIRSCRAYTLSWMDLSDLTLARGSLRATTCAELLATPRPEGPACEQATPRTWPEADCAAIGLAGARRCFLCDASTTATPDDDGLTSVRTLALMDGGCDDAIYYAGDFSPAGNDAFEAMAKELPSL